MNNNIMKKNATINPGTTLREKPLDKKLLLPTSQPKSSKPRLKTIFNQKAKSIAKSVDSAISSFLSALKYNLFLALLAMLVVKFCPEVASKCPVFFQLCEGILVFYEFLLKFAFTILKIFIQLITLNWLGAGKAVNSLSAMFTEAGRLISEFFNWIQVITF